MANPVYALGMTLRNLSPWRKGKSNGTRGLPILVDFSQGASQNFQFDISPGPINNDGSGGSNQIGITDIQSVYIDNRNNASATIIQINDVFGQFIIAPAGSQGIYPVFFTGNQFRFNASSVGGSVMAQLVFLNTDMPYNVWNAGFTSQGTLVVSGSVTSLAPVGPITDRGFTFTNAGGTAQQMIAANGLRKSLAIRNPALPASQGIGAPEPCVISFGAGVALNTAAGWELLPGESISTSEFIGVDTTQALFVNCATPGHIIQAFEG